MKRLQGDIKMLQKKPLELIDAKPDPDDMLTWYFIIKGPPDSHYTGGMYIGKIMHNPEYPFKAPDFMMLTPNGRFEINKKICLTNSGYHSESWSAMWNISTILLGFISIMADDSTSGISHIKRSEAERQALAKGSMEFNNKNLKKQIDMFEDFVNGTRKMPKSKEEKEKEKKEKKAKKDKEKKETEDTDQVDQVNEDVVEEIVVEKKRKSKKSKE